MGMVSYYRKFIRSFSEVAAPLHDLTKKGQIFQWGDKEERAMQNLKDALTEAPVLRLADPEKKYVVATDASNYAIGGVLMQGSESDLHPIAFISRKLRTTELKYDTYDKEMIAIVYALQQWRHYLEGAPRGV